jgi:hypothetical protein
MPKGSVLVGMSVTKLSNGVLYYTRTWKMPQCIVIKGLHELVGQTTFSKIENLLNNCVIPTNYITVLEHINNDQVKLHFHNKYLKRFVNSVLSNYVSKHHQNKVFLG